MSMTVIIIVFLSFFPCGLFAFYGIRRSWFSTRGALVLCLSAVAAILGALILSRLLALPSRLLIDAVSWDMPRLPGLIEAVYSSFVMTAFAEETARLGVFVALVTLAGRTLAEDDLEDREGARRDDFAFNRSLLARAALFGLAFAAFEGVVYGMALPRSVFARMITAVPVHALAMICSVSFWAVYRSRPRVRAGSVERRGFVVACALHGLFSFILLVGPLRIGPAFIPVALAALGLLFLAARKCWRAATAAEKR